MLERLETVATFDDSVRAALAKNCLEAQGIAAVLTDGLTVATDWSLSTAVGGIKLQVAPGNLDRAARALAEFTRVDADGNGNGHAITTAEESRALAEDRADEQEEANPSNQLADRIWRAAVGGLLFFPLHFYVWWLLLSLSAVPTRVSRGRRWKIWAAVALNIPLWCMLAVLLMLTGAFFPRRPADPFATTHWRGETFAPFGPEVSVTFPNAFDRQAGDSITADGERIDHRQYFTRVKSTQFLLLLKQYPPGFAQRPAEQLYEREIEELKFHNAPADLQEKKAVMSGQPAREVLINGQTVIRCRLLVADNRFYALLVSGGADDVGSDDAAIFLGSFRLR